VPRHRQGALSSFSKGRRHGGKKDWSSVILSNGALLVHNVAGGDR
jgi:hypothetical protein